MQMEMEMFQNEFLEEDVPLPQQSFFDNAEMVSTGICTHKRRSVMLSSKNLMVNKNTYAYFRKFPVNQNLH
jgi:hypothetical protein